MLVKIDKQQGGHDDYYYGHGSFHLDLNSQPRLWMELVVVAEHMKMNVHEGILLRIVLDNHTEIHIHMGIFVASPSMGVSPSSYWCLGTHSCNHFHLGLLAPVVIVPLSLYWCLC